MKRIFWKVIDISIGLKLNFENDMI